MLPLSPVYASKNDLSSIVLDRLRLEAALPVELGIARFAHTSSPPDSPYISLSICPPTILTALETMDICYEAWLALPIPSLPQLSQLRNCLTEASAHNSTQILSLEVTYASQLPRLPLWVMNVWPYLGSIISHSQSWAATKSMLDELANTAHLNQILAQELLSQLSSLPIDSPISPLTPFRTSNLPGLLRNAWLSDEHINAAWTHTLFLLYSGILSAPPIGHQQLNPEIFATLRPQRISQWRDRHYPDVLKWTESHLEAIKAGSRRELQAKGGRRGIFHGHPEVVQAMRSCLTDLRKTGLRLNLSTIRGYMVGVIQHYIPDAFTRANRSGKLFRCSNKFTRQFLHAQLGWSVRKATRAAQKHPPNVNMVLLNAFLRFACVVRDEDIPACCIVNADQTQVVYNPGDQKTWNAIGARQVQMVGADDKRAFTLLVAASNSGDVLPVQAIYTGKSPRSLPDATAPGFSDAQRLGFLLEYSETATYWSTFKTMCHWVTDVLVPHFISQRVRYNLPVSQRCILQIDCWTVHRSAAFRNWMTEQYPWIIVLCVPGGCTGLFQPCDVGLQRILKLAISKAAHTDIVVETVNKLQSGIPADQVINDQSLPTLRNRSLNWILQGFYAINKPELVKKAFALCAVPGTSYNLSYESLTSHAARQAILELRATNPELYADITSGHHSPSRVSSEEDLIPGADDEFDSEDMDHTVEDLCAAVLNSRTATEVAQQFAAEPDSEDEEYDSPVLPPSHNTVPTRSGRVPKLSSRYKGSNWQCH